LDHKKSFKENPDSKSPMGNNITAADALQVGLLLSQQEKEFGTNMYESLRPEDEEELAKLVNSGLSSQDAALQIFQKKFVYRIRSDEEILIAQKAKSSSASNSPLKVSHIAPHLIHLNSLINDHLVDCGPSSRSIEKIRFKFISFCKQCYSFEST
jgi:hypothetical protein